MTAQPISSSIKLVAKAAKLVIQDEIDTLTRRIEILQRFQNSANDVMAIDEGIKLIGFKPDSAEGRDILSAAMERAGHD